MANTLTALAPVAYTAAAIVPRELVGYVASARRDFDDKGAALNDTIKVPSVPAKSTDDYTPAMTTTAGGDSTPTTVDVKITASKLSSFHLTGEQERSLENGGDNAKEFMRQNIEQAIRALINGMELAGHTEIYKAASRAYGTAGTTPFASAISDIPEVKKILKDNGIPDDGNLSLVLSSAASTNLAKIPTLNGNAPGSVADNIMNAGAVAKLHNVFIRESGQITAHTIGTGSTSYAVNLEAGYAVGSDTIALDTGSGTIVAGDIFTNTQSGVDANKYVVKTALASGSLVLNAPGIRKAWADNNTTAVGAAYTPNVLLHRNCAVLVARNPIIPANANIEQLPITDPVTGLTFLLCRVAGDGMVTYRVHACYGWKALDSRGIAILLG